MEHVFAWKQWIVKLKDDLEVTNHTQKPNVVFEHLDGNIRIIKDIKVDEEHLINYNKLGSYPNFYQYLIVEEV